MICLKPRSVTIRSLTLAGRRREGPLGAPDQGLVQVRGGALPPPYPRGRGVVAEDEAPARRGPAVKGGRQREVGVATQEDVREPGPPAHGDRLIKVGDRALVRRPVGAAVLDEERFAGVRQRHEQRAVTPDAVIRNVHPLLAGARRGDQGPVAIDPRGLLDQPRTALPDLKPGLVDGVHQGLDLLLVEPATEVARRRRVREAVRPQGVEKDPVRAPQLDIVQRLAAAEEVIRNIQHVVRLIIGLMDLEHPDVRINPCGQPDSLHQAMNGANPTVRDRLRLLGELVTDVRGREHGAVHVHPHRSAQPALNSSLLRGEDTSSLVIHLKSLHSGSRGLSLTTETQGFSDLFT